MLRGGAAGYTGAALRRAHRHVVAGLHPRRALDRPSSLPGALAPIQQDPHRPPTVGGVASVLGWRFAQGRLFRQCGVGRGQEVAPCSVEGHGVGGARLDRVCGAPADEGRQNDAPVKACYRYPSESVCVSSERLFGDAAGAGGWHPGRHRRGHAAKGTRTHTRTKLLTWVLPMVKKEARGGRSCMMPVFLDPHFRRFLARTLRSEGATGT